jgi:hypothetical protein
MHDTHSSNGHANRLVVCEVIPQAVSAKPATPVIMEPLAVGKHDVARLLGISVPTLERWESSDKLGPAGIKKGGRKLWPLAELKAWVAAGMPERQAWLAIRRATGNPARG